MPRQRREHGMTSMEQVTINLLWHPQAQFAGYLVAERLGFGNEAGVQIRTTPLDFAVGPVRSVLSGASLFGVASPSHLLESQAPAELRLLLAIQQDSPLVYPVRRSSGIRTPRDLEGCKVGVWPGREDLEFRWLLHKAGADPEAVERIPMKDTVSAFLADEVASAQVTLYHELHQIEAGGLGHEQLHLFRPSDYGAALLKDGLFALRSLTDERPDLVQAAVDAVLRGWAHAFAHPREAVDICLAVRPELDRREQEAQLRDIRALTFCNATREHGLGYPDRIHARRAAAALRDLGEAVPDDLAECLVDDRFWLAASSAFKVKE
jgi:NitT/TauT family transport system substrate-binding protein